MAVNESLRIGDAIEGFASIPPEGAYVLTGLGTIGSEVGRALLNAGSGIDVIVANRDPQAFEVFQQKLGGHPGRLHRVDADFELTDRESVHRAAEGVQAYAQERALSSLTLLHVAGGIPGGLAAARGGVAFLQTVAELGQQGGVPVERFTLMSTDGVAWAGNIRARQPGADSFFGRLQQLGGYNTGKVFELAGASVIAGELGAYGQAPTVTAAAPDVVAGGFYHPKNMSREQWWVIDAFTRLARRRPTTNAEPSAHALLHAAGKHVPDKAVVYVANRHLPPRYDIKALHPKVTRAAREHAAWILGQVADFRAGK